MNEVADKLNIELCQIRDDDCLKFTFNDQNSKFNIFIFYKPKKTTQNKVCIRFE